MTVDIELQELGNLIQFVFKCSVKSKNRSREFVNAKYAFVNIAYNTIGRTYTDIARFIGCQHATIIHYNNNFEGVYKTDPYLQVLYNTIDLELLDKKTIQSKIDYHLKQIELLKSKLETELEVA